MQLTHTHTLPAVHGRRFANKNIGIGLYIMLPIDATSRKANTSEWCLTSSRQHIKTGNKHTHTHARDPTYHTHARNHLEKVHKYAFALICEKYACNSEYKYMLTNEPYILIYAGMCYAKRGHTSHAHTSVEKAKTTCLRKVCDRQHSGCWDS